MTQLRVLDLFSGIGGFSLGLERAGMKTVAFCEIDPFCQRVLAKHWPGIPIYEDVRSLSAQHLTAAGITVDVICGGFPCQDISFAGKGAGLAGERSGLWSEYRRLIGELRPRYVIVENVAALLGRGLGCVLGDLAALGYDAEWHCIPASAVGAPHRRDRVWIVAYSDSSERWPDAPPRRRMAWADALSQWQESSGGLGSGDQALAYTSGERCAETRQHCEQSEEWTASSGSILADSNGFDRRTGTIKGSGGWIDHRPEACDGGWWSSEPDVGRMAHGVPSRVDRLRSLGNAVVPQIPEIIGRAIMTAREAA